MLRMWRHLRLLKRGGRAHNSTGARGTSPGELAVLCPACPYPDINLPDDWKSVAKNLEYVPNVYLMILNIYALLDIFIIRVLALMPASVSNDGKYQATTRIPS